MTEPAKFVDAAVYAELRREHDKLRAEHTRLYRATADIQRKSYEEGRDDARREYLRLGSRVEQGDGLAHLELPNNGGSIQFHVVGPMLPRPLVGGILSPDADFSLRIWGPPDERGHFGVHEQGGGNMTDFSMSFDLGVDGMTIHRMDVTGLRTKWADG